MGTSSPAAPSRPEPGPLDAAASRYETGTSQLGTLSPLTSTHLRAAWLGLLVFTLGGVVLEVLLAWKVPWLINAENLERRHLLRLAHAHGTLLSLVQIAFVVTVSRLAASGATRLASRCLLAAVLVMPAGFFVGALGAEDGDPGVGIALVPLGAIFLVGGVSILTLLTFRRGPADRS